MMMVLVTSSCTDDDHDDHDDGDDHYDHDDYDDHDDHHLSIEIDFDLLLSKASLLLRPRIGPSSPPDHMMTMMMVIMAIMMVIKVIY